jgi:simple sugar transport system permease protein
MLPERMRSQLGAWRIERRPAAAAWLRWASPLLALLLTAVIAAMLFAMLSKNPWQGLAVFFVEPLRNAYALSELALKATPLMLCALGLAIGFRANVWNIGAEGQFLLGAICAGWVALQVGGAALFDLTPLGSVGLITLLLLAGMLGGMAWAGIVAWLRDRCNANEILVSLMLVYVAQLLLAWLVYGPMKDPAGFNFPQTPRFSAASVLPKLIEGTRLHIGFVVALLAALAAWLFMFRARAGHALQVAGLAPQAARYAGYSARRALWTSLLISGAAAGLAGAFEAAGPLRQLTPYVSAGYGFAAIIVAFVGRLHPLGIVLASLLLSMFFIGGELAQSRLGLPNALSGVFQGVLLFSLLACDALILYRLRRVA